MYQEYYHFCINPHGLIPPFSVLISYLSSKPTKDAIVYSQFTGLVELLNCVVHILLSYLCDLIFILTSIVFRDLSRNHIFRVDDGAFNNTVALETL